MATRCWHCHHIKEGIIRYRIVVCSQLPSGTTSKKRISSWCLSPYWCWPRELALFAWCWSLFVSRCETSEFFWHFGLACLARLSQSAWPQNQVVWFWVYPLLLDCSYPSLSSLWISHHWHQAPWFFWETWQPWHDGIGMAKGQEFTTNLQCLEFILYHDISWYIMIYYDIVICK